MEDVFFNIKKNLNRKVAELHYTHTDENNIIYPMKSIFVDFSKKDESVKKMKDIKKKHGKFFMFFNNSDEGVCYWNKHKIIIK